MLLVAFLLNSNHMNRGKHKPFFHPKNICADHVVVVNCRELKFSGDKLKDKKYQWHTGYPGGLVVCHLSFCIYLCVEYYVQSYLCILYRKEVPNITLLTLKSEDLERIS